MGRGLHGRGALFEAQPPGLASRLIGLRPYELLTSPYEHPEPPFVVLAGARGLGKSMALAELRTAYRGHTPVALIDCEADRLTRLPAGRPAATWSPVWQALTTVAEQLREPVVHGAGSIDFPRLEAGLLAVCATGWGSRDEDSAREEARRILLLSDPARRWAVIAQGWAGKVASRLIANLSGTGPVGQAVIEATLDTLFDLVWTPNGLLKAGADWYSAYPGASGDAKRGLIEIARDFRADGTSRADAERWLLRALLADLGDTYRRRWERMRRVGRPVVLVDNVQSGPGPGLMKAVLRERADGTSDQVVFVAGLRGRRHPELPDAVRHPLPEVARASGWVPGASPSSRALLVTLPALTPEEARRVIADVCATDADGSTRVEVPPQLPYAIHRLTAGSPLGAAMLGQAVRQNRPVGAVSPGELLTAGLKPDGDAEGDRRPVYRELLDRLVPPGLAEELAVLATAHDGDSARALAEARLGDSFGAAGVNRLRTQLTAEGLPPAEGYFVGDPFLRTLLLLRLHLDDADHGRWRAVHRSLLSHYDGLPGNPDTPARARYRLHHELALGDTADAVAYLRNTFRTITPYAWLETLLFVTAAPYYHAHDPHGRDIGAPGDHRKAVALARTDAEEDPPAGVDQALHLTVRRLLHAVWQVTDPLVLPDEEVAGRMHFDLEQLSNIWPAGSEPLWRAAQQWPEQALAGRPLRVPAGDDRDGGGR
ncbi:hypothetical protein OG496_32765 [Streptomyces sp. NBC_00988]|uniref:hypothetical protein n=1 Tax=Streptomyces sp. NBC_00988 TaxID=2903704 RepID=UPI0038676DF9|nr:hypothetical protein OG496_32765 [Streptomyces sp. NBC_00988]